MPVPETTGETAPIDYSDSEKSNRPSARFLRALSLVAPIPHGSAEQPFRLHRGPLPRKLL